MMEQCKEFMAILLKAVQFAAEKHKYQKRKGADRVPYINHPIDVAYHLCCSADVTDVKILAAALLHDTIEDTDATAEEIKKLFGEEILSLVLEVTDDKGLAKKERKRRQIEHAQELSPGASLIKLSDKLSNISDIAESPPRGWSRKRKREYVGWSRAVVDRLRKTNKKLENAFHRKANEAEEELDR
jgi:guanosine-3',5'-bis(diphosphate) 3'-pyrophosphohydrolase